MSTEHTFTAIPHNRIINNINTIIITIINYKIAAREVELSVRCDASRDRHAIDEYQLSRPDHVSTARCFPPPPPPSLLVLLLNEESGLVVNGRFTTYLLTYLLTL